MWAPLSAYSCPMNDASLTLQPFLCGLAFPECPRWRGGALWYSDFYTHQVMHVTMDGQATPMAEVHHEPGGLGWLPDGRLLVVSRQDRRLLRIERDGELVMVADLSSLAHWPCNDMLVDAQGRAYIGNFGFDLPARAPFAPTCLILVTPGGAPRVVAEDMHFPNGCAMTSDGRTLIVAESYGARLTAFDVQEDGSLSGRRIWAQLQGKGVGPDGITLDAEGAIWMASPVSKEVLRVKEGGEVTHRIPTQQQAVACELGGEDGRTLFVFTTRVMLTPQESLRTRLGAIQITQVEIPRA